MKNDLTPFEKNLLRSINFLNNKNFTYKRLMEWNTDKKLVEKNLQDGEKVYETAGVYVAIKESEKG